MEKINQLENLLTEVRKDAEGFYSKGNQAAGRRLRLKMQQVKKLATEIRVNVSEIKNAAL